MKCHFKISEMEREWQFEKYYGLKEKASQWFFLSKLISIAPVKRRRTVVEEGNEPFRKQSYQYYLRDGKGTKVPVCQTMFLGTFDISISVVKTALKKNSPDKRGKHGNRKRISPLLIQSVKDHIKSFPMVESHYCRAESTKQYLDEHLTVSQMHRLYLLGRAADAPHTANARQYRDIFNTCFNLGFFKPKKDQCGLCSDWQLMTDEQKSNQRKAQEYYDHREAKERVRALRKEEKELSRDKDAMAATGKNIRVITMDMQKVLYCPKSEVAEFYYKRKLSVFNFTIFDCTTKQAYLYVWDLSTGNKGSDEVSSFLLQYFDEVTKTGVNDIRIYSDSCTGQNKNQFLYSMYQLAAIKYGITITHRYGEKGHTQMECDSVHARIEKKTRNASIFTPKQWFGYMRTAKVTKPAYKVIEAKQKDIYEFRSLAKHFTWKKVPISKLREIVTLPTSPGKITFKEHLNLAGKEVDVLLKKQGRPINLKTYKLTLAYSNRLALKPKVVNDLKWYIQKQMIPDEHLDFYHQITQPPPDEVVISEDDNDVPQEIIPNVNVQEMLEETNDSDAEQEERVDDVQALPQVNGDNDDGASTDSETFD